MADGNVVQMKRMALDYMVYFGSPLKGAGDTKAEVEADFARNLKWAEDRCRDLVVKAGVVPYAPHAFFPRFLNDNVEEERWAGMSGGLVTLKRCNESVFYLPPWRDGPSGGMVNDAAKATEFKVTVHNVRSEQAWTEYLYNLRQRVMYAPQIRVA
jgi:hypothetical protein